MVENVEAAGTGKEGEARRRRPMEVPAELDSRFLRVGDKLYRSAHDKQPVATITPDRIKAKDPNSLPDLIRSEEHTSELQSLMRISYAVFCLTKKKKQNKPKKTQTKTKQLNKP